MRFLVTSVVSGVLLLISVPPAAAETKTLKGEVVGDPGSKLIIKIQRLGGSPFRVKSFAFKRVTFECFGDTPSGRFSGKVGRMKIDRQPNPFNQAKKADVYFSGPDQTTVDRQVAVFITGVSNRKATVTSGNFGFSFGDGCTIDKGDGFARFTASA